MRLNSVRIANYKGFLDSGTVELGKHWTLVVGKNNSGKSALLESLAFSTFKDKPHRHISRSRERPLEPQSRVEVSARIAAEELEQSFLVQNGEVHVPVPRDNRSRKWVESNFLRAPELNFEIFRTGRVDWQSAKYPSHQLFNFLQDGGQSFCWIVRAAPNKQQWEPIALQGSHQDNVASLAGNVVAQKSYVFRAERRVSGTSPMVAGLDLATDASNLPGVLHYLYSSNRIRFDRYMSLVKEVLSDVEAVSVKPVDAGNVQIHVWNSGYEQERDDLAIPLEECGTGIGQVLAILFILITANTGRLIVVDEPNSFLHPGAARELMRILRNHDQHQYVVTTHSPEIIAATNPEKFLVVRWERGESKIDCYEGVEISGIKSAFEELGVRLSDVYGMDGVIWVEGATEATCFPELLRASGGNLPTRTGFVAIVNTGDFEGQQAEVVWRIYKRLTDQSALVPRAIAISLDREVRSESTRRDLTKRSNGLMHFLPRRTYEN